MSVLFLVLMIFEEQFNSKKDLFIADRTRLSRFVFGFDARQDQLVEPIPTQSNDDLLLYFEQKNHYYLWYFDFPVSVRF
jgi:hypothetical protein